MIPAKRLPAQPARWQQLWREAISDPRELLQLLDLSHLADTLLASADTDFALRVPRGFVARMRRGDASISEVILSGGDPLSLSTPKLAELTGALADIGHVRRLRIHTRLPVVLPERVDTELLAWLGGLRFQRVVVLHANHANELDGSVAAACADLREAGATVLNQSVLLRAVNDDVDALQALSERLFECGVLPYYLHQLDRVQGAAHFEIADARALALVTELAARVPGYLVPRLVREVAGAPAKMPLPVNGPMEIQVRIR